MKTRIQGKNKEEATKSNSILFAIASTGAGLYWTSMLLAVFIEGGLTPDNSSESVFFSRLPMTLLALALCFIALIGRKSIANPKTQRVWTGSILGLMVFYNIFGFMSTFINLPSSIMTLRMIIILIAPSLLMVFWSLVFAGLNRRAVISVVVSSTLVACLAYLIAVIIIPWLDCSTVRTIYISISAILLFSINCFIPMFVEQRKPNQDRRGFLFFYSSRAIYGVFLGLLSIVTLPLSHASSGYTVTTDSLLFILPTVVIAVVLIVQLLRSAVNPFIACMPLLAVFIFFLPKLDDGDITIQFLWGALWVSWIILSYTQLTEAKIRLGLSETVLSFSEKIVVLTFWIIGMLLGSLIQTYISESTNTINLFRIMSVLFVFVGLFFSMGSLLGLSERHKQLISITDTVLKEEKHTEVVLIEFAKRYGLSVREGEICSLLIKGYTKTHISASLMIAESTVKTHTEHIYKKVGCRKKSDLIKLYETMKNSYKPAIW